LICIRIVPLIFLADSSPKCEEDYHLLLRVCVANKDYHTTIMPRNVERITTIKESQHLQRKKTRESQPIPVKSYKEEQCDEGDSAKYEWSTWMMYNLITNARTLRSSSQGHHKMTQVPSKRKEPTKVATIHTDGINKNEEPNTNTETESFRKKRRSSLVMDEESIHDGVFILE
jgi:hypothetical protein